MSERARIAVLSLYPRDFARIAGGVRAVAHNLVAGLQEFEDLDIQVIHYHSDISEDAQASDGRASIHYLAAPRRRWMPNMTSGMAKVRHKLDELRPDLVHAHIAPLAVAAQRSGYPWLYTIHGLAGREARSYTGTLYDRLRYGLYAYYDRLAVRRATDLIAISDYARTIYEPQTSARWHRIDNPIPDAFFQERDAGEGESNTVLFVGSITEVKGIEMLLHALAEVKNSIPDVHLRLAGRVTSDAYRARLDALIGDLGLRESITFLGLLDRGQLLAAYAGCSALALPSRQENAPMAVIEAMASSTPVVATRVGGVPEIVQDGESGYLVDPGDAHAMAQRLVELLSSSELCRRLGHRAHLIARERFSIQRVAAQHRELYLELIGRDDKVARPR